MPEIYNLSVLMRAEHVTQGRVYWVSLNVADFVGTFSGYTPGDLSNIVKIVDFVDSATPAEPPGAPLAYGFRLYDSDIEYNPYRQALATGDIALQPGNLPIVQIVEDA